MLKVNYMFKSKQSSWKLFRQKILPPCVNIVNIKQLSSSGKKGNQITLILKKVFEGNLCIDIWNNKYLEKFLP